MNDLAGINIQYPISELILSGKKTVETRTYKIPEYYVGQEMAFIETPGKSGKFKSRIVGIVVFGDSYKYKNPTDFYSDFDRHQVSKDSTWAWTSKGKWGWPILSLKVFKKPIPVDFRLGIIYTKGIKLKKIN